jgi:RNA polymerase sigma factor (sigma-70 family)
LPELFRVAVLNAEGDTMNVLIERAKWGDDEATEKMVAELRQRLERMASYYAGICHEDAGDLLQEAWIGVFEGVRDVDLSIGSPRHYLLERAKWKILDFVKYNKRRRHDQLEDSLVCGHSPLVEDSALSEAFTEEFMTRLTPFQQSVVKQLLTGRTWREAGQKLGCSSANVAYHIRKIKQEYEKMAASVSD